VVLIKRQHMKRYWWLLLLLIPIILILGFTGWAMTGPSAAPEALAALTPDAQVDVTQDGWLVFQPTGSDPTTGLIFYPGGRVDPRAYAPLAREIAAAGYLVVIVPMPLNLAVLGAGRAQEVIAAYPEIEYWAIGGHSLGGSMAANFAASNPTAVDGLVLWAAYPAGADDLSAQDLAVVSIYGTEDGLATQEDINASRALLPPDTLFVPIEGGNHAQFGAYGPQPGDNPAMISAAEQQDQIVRATVELLANLSADGR
jgi:hypothetical protein